MLYLGKYVCDPSMINVYPFAHVEHAISSFDVLSTTHMFYDLAVTHVYLEFYREGFKGAVGQWSL